MKRLIVTADDFGLAVEVNAAVEAAHSDGILTAASLMVSGAAAADAVARARRLPRLAVGLHLVLVEGRPTLPPDHLPDLVTPEGRLRSDLARLGAAIAFSPRVRRQMAAEIAAQFEAFGRTGLALDHVNAHKHFHLHPVVAGLVLRIGREHGMAALRVPLEPPRVLAAIEPGAASPVPERALARWLARRATRARLMAPDQVFGLAWSGAMTGARVTGLLAHLPEGVSEIYLHPATNDGFAGAAPGYAYAEEWAALVAPETRAAARAAGAGLGGYAASLSVPARPRETRA